MLCVHAPRIDTCDTPVVAFIQNAGYKASLRVQSERSGGVPPLSIRDGRSTSFRSALEPNIYYSRSLLIDRHAGALRFCLAAERIIRGGTRHCAALFPGRPSSKTVHWTVGSPRHEGLRPEYFAVCGRRRGSLPAGAQPAAERCPPDTPLDLQASKTLT